MKTKKYILFIPLIILMIASLYTMYTVKSINTKYDNYLMKQAIWYFVGFIVLIVISKIPIKKFRHLPFILYVMNVILLLLVLFVGKEINGAKAWFNLKYFAFQPSELMKLSLSLYLSQVISKHKKETIYDEMILITKVLLLILIPSILVFLEPDTGAIILYVIIGFTMLILAKLNKWWYIISVLFITILLGLFFYCYFNKQDLLIKLIGSSFFYRMDRLLNFKDGNGFQINNALIAIGSSSLYRFNKVGTIYIPEAPTDFVVSYLVNITGLVGLIVVLLCYLVVDIYFINMLFKEKNTQSKTFIGGFIGMFLYQQFQNILMNVGLFPIMGIPLPFLSYGGTNIVVYFLFIGVIYSNSIKYKRKKRLLHN